MSSPNDKVFIYEILCLLILFLLNILLHGEFNKFQLYKLKKSFLSKIILSSFKGLKICFRLDLLFLLLIISYPHKIKSSSFSSAILYKVSHHLSST